MIHAHAAAIVAAARSCVGTRFRPRGRLPGTGLDCVGVVLVAARAAGVRFEVPTYRIGGDHHARLDAELAEQGCRAVAGEPGDVLVLVPARGRRHLGVLVPGGLVHAHAGLGRVVEGPLDPAWVIAGVWRLPAVNANYD